MVGNVGSVRLLFPEKIFKPTETQTLFKYFYTLYCITEELANLWNTGHGQKKISSTNYVIFSHYKLKLLKIGLATWCKTTQLKSVTCQTHYIALYNILKDIRPILHCHRIPFCILLLLKKLIISKMKSVMLYVMLKIFKK